MLQTAARINHGRQTAKAPSKARHTARSLPMEVRKLLACTAEQPAQWSMKESATRAARIRSSLPFQNEDSADLIREDRER